MKELKGCEERGGGENCKGIREGNTKTARKLLN